MYRGTSQVGGAEFTAWHTQTWYRCDDKAHDIVAESGFRRSCVPLCCGLQYVGIAALCAAMAAEFRPLPGGMWSSRAGPGRTRRRFGVGNMMI